MTLSIEDYQNSNINEEELPIVSSRTTAFTLKKIIFKGYICSFIYFPRKKVLKIMKKAFHFIEKALLTLEVFKFWYFPIPLISPLSALLDIGKTYRKLIIVYDVTICLNRNLKKLFKILRTREDLILKLAQLTVN